MTAALEMIANTVKPILLLISDTQDFKDSLEMHDQLAPTGGGKPFVIL